MELSRDRQLRTTGAPPALAPHALRTLADARHHQCHLPVARVRSGSTIARPRPSTRSRHSPAPSPATHPQTRPPRGTPPRIPECRLTSPDDVAALPEASDHPSITRAYTMDIKTAPIRRESPSQSLDQLCAARDSNP